MTEQTRSLVEMVQEIPPDLQDRHTSVELQHKTNIRI